MTFYTKLFSTLILMCSFSLMQAQNANEIWSEDFANGIPADWTNVDAAGFDAIFTYCGDPATGQQDGCPSLWDDDTNQQEPFASETVLNGFVTMDSDLVGQIAGNHISELTTGLIDLTANPEVYFSMQSHIGVFTLDASDNAILRVSTDLENWTNVTIFAGLDTGVRWSENPASPVVNISDAAGGQSVYLQFQWTGNYEYHWSIDDVVLYDGDPRFANDLQVDNFFAIAPNEVTPASQVESFGFLADISNQGSTDQDGIVLTGSVNLDGAEVFSTTLAYDPIAVDSTTENQVVVEEFTPEATPGLVYTGLYSVAGTNADDDLENNTKEFTFAISDTLFSKALTVNSNITPASGNWDDGENWQWSYGNHYHVVNGVGKYARTIGFSLDGTEENAGQTILVSLYEVVDGDPFGEITPDERVRVGVVLYPVTGEEDINTTITVPIYQLNGDVIELKDNTDYLAMVEFAIEGQIRFDLGANRDLYYNATSLRSEAVGAPRYAQILGLSSDLETEDFSSAGFGDGVVPVVNFSIGNDAISGVKLPILSADNKVQLSPNPAKDLALLDLDLVEISSEVEVIIFDTKGQYMFSSSLDNVQNQQIRLDVAHYPAGMYFVHVRTDAGIVTKSLVVK